MIKSPKIYGFILISLLCSFLLACNKVDLYDLKTDINNKDKILKIVEYLDWNKLKVEKVETEDKEIKITFSGNEPDSKNRDIKTMFTNGVYLLILVENSDAITYLYDRPSFSIDTKIANIVLDTNYNKNIIDYRNNREDFNELLTKLKEIKFEKNIQSR